MPALAPGQQPLPLAALEVVEPARDGQRDLQLVVLDLEQVAEQPAREADQLVGGHGTEAVAVDRDEEAVRRAPHPVDLDRSNRDSAWFALLDREWPAVRAAFERWLAADNFDAAGRQRMSLGALMKG